VEKNSRKNYVTDRKEEAPEKGKELSHSAEAIGMDE
jgi:hypothetical protein